MHTPQTPLDPLALLFGPAFLRSPVLQRLAEAHDHPWRELYIAPMHGQERLYCNTRDLLDLLHVLCPAYTDNLTDHEKDTWLTTAERLVAVDRLVDQMHRGVRRPQAARVLREVAAAREIPSSRLVRTEFFPEAALLAIREAGTPQRMRLGQQWITNAQGKVRIEAPVKALSSATFARWWFAQVYAAANAIVLGEAYPRLVSQTARVALYDPQDLEALVQQESPSAQESAMLATLLHDEDPEPAAQLQAVLDIASPRERELLTLLAQGRSRNEAAHAMSISRSTVDVLMHRIRKKAATR